MVAASEVLIDRARGRVGSENLGPDGWQEGLEHLLAAVDADLGDKPTAVGAVEEILVNRLVGRLRVERWYAGRDASAAPPIEGPVVIVGLPRTATTALHYLLAVDPQFRYQRNWELADPVRPPGVTTEAEDPRRPAGGVSGDSQHIRTVDGPLEDIGPTGLHFHNQDLSLPLPSYTAWWRHADLSTTFAYHERVLRLLSAQYPPNRWLLKAPAHMFAIERLVERYPTVRFVVTHRDPVEALPSTCSTIVAAQGRLVPGCHQDPAKLGRDLLEHFVEGTERLIDARPRVGEERFLDVGQRDVERDPVGTAERVHDFLGLRLTDQVRTAMAEFADANRRGARGSHRYAPEDYGLDADGIRHAFDRYLSRFGNHFER